MRADDGDDWVFGGAGSDWISGGAGNDRLYGGDDDDVLFGDDGDDEMHGEAGNDLLFGGRATTGCPAATATTCWRGRRRCGDIVLAEAGNDTVIGEDDRADDTYAGGEGDSTSSTIRAVTGAIELDLAEGEASAQPSATDQLSGFEAVATGSGDDWVVGSDCDDTIDTGEGDDWDRGRRAVPTRPTAGSGDDQILGALDAVADTFAGGEGTDTLDYSSACSRSSST